MNEDEQYASSLFLQAKYRELREHYQTLRRLYFRIECAWCKQPIGWKLKHSSAPGETSHGMCPQCVTVVEAS